MAGSYLKRARMMVFTIPFATVGLVGPGCGGSDGGGEGNASGPQGGDGPQCGNNQKEDRETCDGTDLGGQTCEDLGWTGGTLVCKDDCSDYDTTGCTTETAPPECGNNVRDPGENCDGMDVGSSSCEGLGYGPGVLRCNADCSYDTSGCGVNPACGDGRRNGSEVCDGADLGGASCSSLDFDDGVLACKNDCSGFDVSRCTTESLPSCGNGIREATEVCDGTDLGGQSCASQGFADGVLACHADCGSYDTSACPSPVGGPCTEDANCANGGVCVPEDVGFPDGYCVILDCHISNGLCPDDVPAACYYIAEDQSQSACLPTCTGDSDCRAGYLCDRDVCFPEQPEPVANNAGASCDGDEDCTGSAPQCWTETDYGFPDGYCTDTNCTSGSCGENAECYELGDDIPSVCLDLCDDHNDCRDGYHCHEVGVCWVGCSPSSCPDDTVCSSSGNCVPLAADLPQGPVPECTGTDLPDWQCTDGAGACGALVEFSPELGDGYWNYPLNGETEGYHNYTPADPGQYRSYIRRDVMMLVKYAAAATRCLTEDWDYTPFHEIGLGDMSEADGSIPGTSIGQLGHPEGTHTNGHDIDIAYFQLGADDNKLRSICEHAIGSEDQYHCVDSPDALDVWRTAVFIAKLHDSPHLRVVGADGKAGAPIADAIAQLCAVGWLNGAACESLALAYEETDRGAGWYRFHHHHIHLSVLAPPAGNASALSWGGANSCITPGCRNLHTVDAQMCLERPKDLRLRSPSPKKLLR